jgi:Na+/H+ antiporter NhaD/arsenite permease-like protein
MLESWQATVALTVFIVVIGLVALEWVHLTIAAMLGALLLVVLNILTPDQAIGHIAQSHATLALFLGVMIMVRALQPTGVFDYLATQMVILAKGQGKRLLLGIVAITTPICAVLPNATTVMLLAPLLPPLAAELEVDYVPLLILLVFVANSSGLLTLAGDPATFIVGNAINISFMDYLTTLSFGGVIALAVILVTLPFLFKRIWRTQLADLDHLPRPQINHPRMLLLGTLIVLLVLVFFVIGETLPIPIAPATVALLGAALLLLISHHGKIDSVNHILRDVDWSTLLFLMSIFVLIGGLQQTGVISQLSAALVFLLGKNVALGTIVMLFSAGLLSMLVPNIPLVVAMLPLLQDYLLNVGLVTPEMVGPQATMALPATVLPLFYGMMYGATLGGNGTIVGAAANIVAAGIAEQYGRPISFKRFLYYGLPTMGLQLVVMALYVGIRFLRV